MEDHRKVNDLHPNHAIIGFGYDHIYLAEGEHPSKAVLDEVANEAPVFLFHQSFHMGVANSQALALADITEASSNPENGKNGRLPDSKEPSGYLEEDAADLVLMPLLADSSIELADLIEAAQYVYLSHGITTVQEGAATQAGMEELIALTQSDQFKVDVVAYPLVTEEPRQILQTYPEYTGQCQQCLKIAGYKILLDGSPKAKRPGLANRTQMKITIAVIPLIPMEQSKNISRWP
ncbi:hypothetical protein CL176_06035 [Suicoccus acidiformans]|uniref:Amidohydrolase 3 domain-containing protein n=1 Tax=Suicoccus acidiformans TaxID=2036206 RepID=A0A347WKI1_9LACT|nr:amidohydrolase family protein [Suicoccus acidiformans]AXY25588.1 hypothetical protein CL176_06035 [Suicoccus acidiformans]